VVAPVAHGHADRPVKLGAAQRGNGQGDKSMINLTPILTYYWAWNATQEMNP